MCLFPYILLYIINNWDDPDFKARLWVYARVKIITTFIMFMFIHSVIMLVLYTTTPLTIQKGNIFQNIFLDYMQIFVVDPYFFR